MITPVLRWSVCLALGSSSKNTFWNTLCLYIFTSLFYSAALDHWKCGKCVQDWGPNKEGWQSIHVWQVGICAWWTSYQPTQCCWVVDEEWQVPKLEIHHLLPWPSWRDEIGRWVDALQWTTIRCVRRTYFGNGMFDTCIAMCSGHRAVDCYTYNILQNIQRKRSTSLSYRGHVVPQVVECCMINLQHVCAVRVTALGLRRVKVTPH